VTSVLYGSSLHVLFCSQRYGFNIDDVLNNSEYVIDIICSYVQSLVTDSPKNVVDLYFECILIRDGLVLLPSWCLKSDVRRSFDK